MNNDVMYIVIVLSENLSQILDCSMAYNLYVWNTNKHLYVNSNFKGDNIMSSELVGLGSGTYPMVQLQKSSRESYQKKSVWK